MTSGDDFIRLPPRTHDISFAEDHISNIERLGADLNDAVNAVWPKRHGIKYSQAHVLLLSWEADDLGVEDEIKGLHHVFRDRFNFQVHSYEISSIKPDKALKRRVLDFLDLDGKDTILIVYYGGHARRGLHSNDSPTWFANRQDISISLPSGGIQSMLEEADADVLLLFDCCHSAGVSTKDALQGTGGVTEVIAACGYETRAAEADEHSFTKALTETLAVASKGCPPTPFSVGELHSRVLRKLKCWTPSLKRKADGSYIDVSDTALLCEHQPRRTPIYSIVSESVPRRSIVLAPLPRPPTSRTSDSGNNGLEDSSSSQGRSTPSQSDSSAESSDRKRKRHNDDDGPCAQILLAIRLEKTELSANAWVEWIRNLPSEGTAVHVEGKYDSFSTLLLLRMPIAVWNLLPGNPAYSFVGFVTSENKAATRPCPSCKTNLLMGSVAPGSTYQDNDTLDDELNTVVKKERRSPRLKKAKEVVPPEPSQQGTDAPGEPPIPLLAALSITSALNPVAKDKGPSTQKAPPTTATLSGAASPAGLWYQKTPQNNKSPIGLSNSALDQTPVNHRSLSNLSGKSANSMTEVAGQERQISSGLTNLESQPVVNDPPSSPSTSKLKESNPKQKAHQTSHRHSSHGKGSHKGKNYDVYHWVWFWNCCACGPSGAVSVDSDSCPEYTCGHVRCEYCEMEKHKVRKAVDGH
ncbi:hypothetical protein LSUE1_G007091 [Lachnellula suecica]|uniref:Uncharacterized protein n=1 Tax=Lachnellula suecica TaxID=602035 RepID=A0A8T9BWM3_9HELO|nr:hypothetical protein LSUE1_G007091 [Lachnellula suecica]